MKLLKLLLLFSFLSLSFSTLAIPIVKADGVDSPILLDAYSYQDGDNRIVNVSGLISDNLEVLVYIDGKYNGLANISKKDGSLNPFHFETKISNKNTSYEITAIAKETTSGILSSVVTIKDRRIIKPEYTIKNTKGGVAPEKILNISQKPTIASSSIEENTLILDKNIEITPPPAPTLIKPTKTDIIAHPKPYVLGLTKNDTSVYIYIDGIFNGKTSKLLDDSGTANFAYMPFLNLEPGIHEVWAVAENEAGKSPVSNTLIFTIEEPMVSPTLLSPRAKMVRSLEKLFISGLAKNDSVVKVFIDHLLDEKIQVKNNESGTANFAYISEKAIKRGKHLVYATATDSRGKESSWSNLIYFTVYEPQIATSVEAETSSTSSLKAIMEVKDSSEIKNTPISNNTIKTKEVGQTKGALDIALGQEDIENKPNNIKLNLTIFILFLIAIAAWMLLVNRELVKEKTKTEETSDKQK